MALFGHYGDGQDDDEGNFLSRVKVHIDLNGVRLQFIGSNGIKMHERILPRNHKDLTGTRIPPEKPLTQAECEICSGEIEKQNKRLAQEGLAFDGMPRGPQDCPHFCVFCGEKRTVREGTTKLECRLPNCLTKRYKRWESLGRGLEQDGSVDVW